MTNSAWENVQIAMAGTRTWVEQNDVHVMEQFDSQFAKQPSERDHKLCKQIARLIQKKYTELKRIIGVRLFLSQSKTKE